MPLNEQLYSPTLRLKSESMISGTIEKDVTVGDDSLPWSNAIIAAFLDDDDIQSLKIVSTNIGFIKTIQKKHKETADANDAN